ncbi:glutathione peroxidase [Nocardioides marmoribigeumensis]|uniref:Glutathione peroxidase n=1 Tax=Nocardioides marmoribigeumensis TaxID=433649 RepID=A0ABU2BUD5_9ACTN|nr:glutathione peroxidase [Nocardioides marmoribigeumensis]MDR7362242.1 glutathione peroxidase [Nocardioides marmoribigeumensis]
MPKLSDFKATRLDGTVEDLSSYDGKVVLVVNTASQCGFTPQLEGLEKLYEQYADQGLVVLGFPCNQFGGQEPGDSEQIGAFCQKNYGVTFPMFEKIEVNGDDAHPLYQWLREEKGGVLGSKIKWNFTKFLINKDGEVVDRFGPTTKPEKLVKDIEDQLEA